MNLRKSLTENLGVKVIAFVVAVFIWFNASGQQQMVRLRTVPLVIGNLPDSLTVTGSVTDRVEIRVTGTRRQLLTLGFKRVHALIDLSGARPGRQRVTLSPGNIQIPSGMDRRNVSVISPSFVDLQIERLVTKRVQASLTTAGRISDDLVMLDDGLSLEPAWITVRGPESTVGRVRTIPTRPFDLARVRESTTRAVALDFDPTLLQCDPREVTVTVEVSEKGQRVLANIPPTVLVDSDDLDAVVMPNAVSITLEGPVAMLDTLSSGDVSVLLNLTGRSAAQYTLAPEVIVPAGIELVGISVDSLIVRLSDRQGSGAP